MLELFPRGFEEVDREGGVELVAYTDAGGEERLWQAFGGARSTEVEEGWEERWRDFHRPVQVGKLWVGPPWEAAPANGRGRRHRPGPRVRHRRASRRPSSASSCCRSSRRAACSTSAAAPASSSIAGALLGYAPVLGVDTDRAAVEATRANALVERGGRGRRAGRARTPPSRRPTWPSRTSRPPRSLGLAGRVDAAHLITSGYLQPDEPALPGLPARRAPAARRLGRRPARPR